MVNYADWWIDIILKFYNQMIEDSTEFLFFFNPIITDNYSFLFIIQGKKCNISFHKVEGSIILNSHIYKKKFEKLLFITWLNDRNQKFVHVIPLYKIISVFFDECQPVDERILIVFVYYIVMQKRF